MTGRRQQRHLTSRRRFTSAAAGRRVTRPSERIPVQPGLTAVYRGRDQETA